MSPESAKKLQTAPSYETVMQAKVCKNGAPDKGGRLRLCNAVNSPFAKRCTNCGYPL